MGCSQLVCLSLNPSSFYAESRDWYPLLSGGSLSWQRRSLRPESLSPQCQLHAWFPPPAWSPFQPLPLILPAAVEWAACPLCLPVSCVAAPYFCLQPLWSLISSNGILFVSRSSQTFSFQWLICHDTDLFATQPKSLSLALLALPPGQVSSPRCSLRRLLKHLAWSGITCSHCVLSQSLNWTGSLFYFLVKPFAQNIAGAQQTCILGMNE